MAKGDNCHIIVAITKPFKQRHEGMVQWFEI